MNFNLQSNRQCLYKCKALTVTLGRDPLLPLKYKFLQKHFKLAKTTIVTLKVHRQNRRMWISCELHMKNFTFTAQFTWKFSREIHMRRFCLCTWQELRKIKYFQITSFSWHYLLSQRGEICLKQTNIAVNHCVTLLHYVVISYFHVK